MKIRPLLYGICLAALCFPAEAATKSKKNLTKVCSGTQKVIKLSANPSTGYLWQAEKLNSTVATVREMPYVASSDTRSGAGGYSKFKISFDKPGEVTVTLRYFRPWERFIPGKDKEKTYSYLVKECPN